MFGGFFGGLVGGTFSGQYRCFPVSFIDKNEAETGNKIFLPSSALDRLGEHRPHQDGHWTLKQRF